MYFTHIFLERNNLHMKFRPSFYYYIYNKLHVADVFYSHSRPSCYSNYALICDKIGFAKQ